MDEIFKIIGYGIGVLILLYLISHLLPYLLFFLAMCGAYAIWEQYNRKRP